MAGVSQDSSRTALDLVKGVANDTQPMGKEA